MLHLKLTLILLVLAASGGWSAPSVDFIPGQAKTVNLKDPIPYEGERTTDTLVEVPRGSNNFNRELVQHGEPVDIIVEETLEDDEVHGKTGPKVVIDPDTGVGRRSLGNDVTEETTENRSTEDHTGTGTEEASSSSTSAQETESSSSWILWGVIGVLAVVVLISLILYFVISKKSAAATPVAEASSGTPAVVTPPPETPAVNPAV